MPSDWCGLCDCYTTSEKQECGHCKDHGENHPCVMTSDTHTQEPVMMPCLECGRLKEANRLEQEGIVNVFCSDADCEDAYAWKH